MSLAARVTKDRTTASKRPVKWSAPDYPRITPISSPPTNSILNRKPVCSCGGACPKCRGNLGIQPKLKIGAPNDKYEQEADRVADQVMRMPVSGIQRQTLGEEEELQAKPLNGKVQRQAEDEEEEEETLQAKAAPGHTPTVGATTTHAKIQSLKGGGQPLPSNQRTFFESRMGHDFSGVRIHTDTHAADAAQAVQARAFTLEKDIVFNSGQYTPSSQEGKKLLAHELTHVVQQDGPSRVRDKKVPTPFSDFAGKLSTNTLIVQRKDKPNKGGDATETEVHTMQYLAQLRELYDKRAKGRGVETQLNEFIKYLSYEGYLFRIIDRRVKAKDVRAFKTAFSKFTVMVGDEILKLLLKDTGTGIKIWRKKVEASYETFQRYDKARQFKYKVEKRLLPAYIAAETKVAVTASGKSAAEISKLADVQVRAIVTQHFLVFKDVTEDGVNAWKMPLVPPDHWSNYYNGTSALASGVGSAITVGAVAGSAIATAGLALLAIGIVAGVQAALKGIDADNEKYRQKRLEEVIKEETVLGFKVMADGIYKKQDVIAVLCTIKALKEKKDLNTIARAELRRFVWKEMFGSKFPHDLKEARKYVTAEMDAKLNKLL